MKTEEEAQHTVGLEEYKHLIGSCYLAGIGIHKGHCGDPRCKAMVEAAPDLLAACEKLLTKESLLITGILWPELRAIEAAVAKAKQGTS